MDSLCLPGNDPCKKSIQYCVDFSPAGSLYFSLQFKKGKGNKALKLRLIIYAKSSTAEPINKESINYSLSPGKGDLKANEGGDGK